MTHVEGPIKATVLREIQLPHLVDDMEGLRSLKDGVSRVMTNNGNKGRQ